MPPLSSGFRARPAEGLNFPSAALMFLARVAKTPESAALRFKKNGSWRSLTWRELEAKSRRLALGLLADGLVPGDRVAIMAHSRMEWVVCDVALALAGLVSVPIYPTVTADEATFILSDADCRALIAGDPCQLERVIEPEHTERLAGLSVVMYFDDEGDLPRRQGGGTRFFADLDFPSAFPTPRRLDLEAESEPGQGEDGAQKEVHELERDSVRERLQSTIESIELLDIFTIVYTSGTTGRPKGVVLANRSIVYEAWAMKNTIAVDRTDSHLLILPLAHIFARHMVWAAVQSGATTAFATSEEKIAEDLRDIAPTYVGGVPRVYEKMHRAILDRARRSGPIKRRGFDWAMDVGRRVSQRRQRGQGISTRLSLKHAGADRAVLDEVRMIFGGRLRFFVSGAAPLSSDIAEFFHAIGILILEGYGLTETSGATNVNRPDRFRFGTVGPALPGCEVLIADDCEVLVRGHNVMVGYHGLPEDTAAVLDEDGWFHTGDLGETNDGFLRITGRKKHVIITAGGKNIPPLKIERLLESQPGIAHAVVCGDERPYLVGLVSLDEAYFMKESKRERLGCRDYGDLVRHPRFKGMVRTWVDEANEKLASYETLKHFAIAPAPFTQASGELTPTLKVRRKKVIEDYKELISSLYEPSGRGSEDELDGA